MMCFSIMRKGASKFTNCSAPKESYLSLAQIFESTDDVDYYVIAELQPNYTFKDKYISNSSGFPKWRKIESESNPIFQISGD